MIVFALLSLCASRSAHPQSRFVIGAPAQKWRTVQTEHWSVHYPASATQFANCLIPRLETIYGNVSALVGFVAAPRVTLVIEDAVTGDGAFASANARAPVIVLQTQPSAPRTGGYSDCTTARMVHELTHVLQLSRKWTSAHGWYMPVFMRMLPAEPGPIVLRRKAWLRESYAEHIEGLLTPTGAPYTTARANAVRMLALEDRLPAYTALSNSYEGQYLIGAAFVDWLAVRSGEQAFRRLWELMASPEFPGDDVAFRTLFDGPPDSLYALFASDAKAKADSVRRRLNQAGLVRGQRIRGIGNADAFAVSPNGEFVAAVGGGPVRRATIWSTRDSSAIPRRLPIPTGQSPSALRFTRDGRLLIVNWELAANNLWRPDVYEWTLATQKLRRVTRGASVREVDPLPDGKNAVGTRCEFGICDMVHIDLATGAVRTLAAGTPDRAYSHPRVSSDGQTVVAAVQSRASSRVVLIDVRSGTVRLADPDDGVWRYEPAFARDGQLVVASEASGIPNLELIDVATRTTHAFTRLVYSAVAPEFDTLTRSVYFIRGAVGNSELWRISLDSVAGATVSVRDSSLGPAAPIPLPRVAPLLAKMFSGDSAAVARDNSADSLFVANASRAYGAGPRFTSVLPGFSFNASGATGSVLLWSSDIVGRVSVMTEGAFGSGAAWHGLALSAAIRSTPMPIFFRGTIISAGTLKYHGGSVRVERESGPWAHRTRLMLGAGVGAVAVDSVKLQSRALASFAYSTTQSQVSDYYASEAVSLAVDGGVTGGKQWARSMLSASIDVGRTNVAFIANLSVKTGMVSGAAPGFERFSTGGMRSTFSDDVAQQQHLSQPFLGVGTARAFRVTTVRLGGPRVGPVSPFVWWNSREAGSHRATTILGVAREMNDEPRRNWRVPGARLAGGLGYAVGFTRGVRGYVSLTFVQ